MDRKARFMARLAELAREYEQKLRPEEYVQSRLRWEDWETLRPEAVAFARDEIRRRRWRGKRGGVLPEGYDAEGVANQVIGEMMAGKCRLAVGWTRERLVNELKRLVSQRVRVLHRLKETQTVRANGREGTGKASR
jgi:CRP-like cAMP-binding protein